MNKKTEECQVKGYVQGIGFRRFVKETAQLYDIKGYVKNLSNGDVKIIMQGNYSELIYFKNKIKKGNGFSRIQKMDSYEIKSKESFNEFRILR
ncbi:MAG: acylphosphatase [Candidatus Cloacimonadota bacterium]|nr:MAG: acylphosphatase [Candidatus Cloacimonadota bacterium]